MTTTYETNPDRRCSLCEGREVITLENGIPTYTSLEGEEDGLLTCKNRVECMQNIRAENTIIEYGEDREGKLVATKISEFGKPLLEVDYDV